MIRYSAKLIDVTVYTLRRQHFESHATTLHIVQRTPERTSGRTLERPCIEIDHRFFTDLEQSKSEIDIERKETRSNLIEHGPSTVPVRFLAKSPCQLFALCLVTDWIAERDPAPSFNAVHKERAVFLSE